MGRSAEFAEKWHVNLKYFERRKNRNDGPDFDDSWTKPIAPTRSIFEKIPWHPKRIRVGEKFTRPRRRHHYQEQATQTTDRTKEKKSTFFSSALIVRQEAIVVVENGRC